jgi:hypothetical protein
MQSTIFDVGNAEWQLNAKYRERVSEKAREKVREKLRQKQPWGA